MSHDLLVGIETQLELAKELAKKLYPCPLQTIPRGFHKLPVPASTRTCVAELPSLPVTHSNGLLALMLLYWTHLVTLPPGNTVPLASAPPAVLILSHCTDLTLLLASPPSFAPR